jgi:hypothetical protein
MPRIKPHRYVIIVDGPAEPPFFVKMDELGVPSLALAISQKPPKSYSYSEAETPILLKRLKSAFPDAAVQAVEVTSIDRIAMKIWWEARIATLEAAQKFAKFANHKRGERDYLN